MSDRVPESGQRPTRALLAQARAAYHAGQGAYVRGAEKAPCAVCGQLTADGHDVLERRFHEDCLAPHDGEVTYAKFSGEVEFRAVNGAGDIVESVVSNALHAALASLHAAGLVRVSHTAKVVVQRECDLTGVLRASVGERGSL